MTLLNLQKETKIKCFGPMGQFTIEENNTRHHIFLAGGIGITPFLSMVHYASEKKIHVPITLFVSFSTTEDVIYYDELTALSKKAPNIKIVYTVTRPEESKKSWNGETGRISVDMVKKYAANVTELVYYLAGPPPMVTAILDMLKEMYISEEQIKKENFVGY